jgi:hypothetical protein
MDAELLHDGVPVRVLEGPYLDNGKPTPDAVTYYSSLVLRLDEFRQLAAEKLLSLYNKSWLDEEIGALDHAGFVARLDEPSVVLYDEIGYAQVYFGDGGLFAGHSIKVSVDQGRPSHIGIVG